jgi:CrcB protein
MHWLSVAIGGAIGALCRYGVSFYLLPASAHKFPYATLAVNALGSFAVGILYVVILERAQLAEEARYLLMIGFLGAFTTFSTFSLDALSLWQNGHQMMALVYVLLTVALCLLAVTGAVWLTRLF